MLSPSFSSCCRMFLINNNHDIPACLRPRSSRILSLHLPHLPLIFLVVTMLSSVLFFNVWPKNEICLFLIVVYNVILCLIISFGWLKITVKLKYLFFVLMNLFLISREREIIFYSSPLLSPSVLSIQPSWR